MRSNGYPHAYGPSRPTWHAPGRRPGVRRYVPTQMLGIERTKNTGSTPMFLEASRQTWDDRPMEAREFPSATLAPSAEIVDGASMATVRTICSGCRMTVGGIELVEGGACPQRGGSSYRATRLAGRVFAALLSFVLAHELGGRRSPRCEPTTLTRRGRNTTGLAPDVGFIAAHRLPLILNPDRAISPSPRTLARLKWQPPIRAAGRWARKPSATSMRVPGVGLGLCIPAGGRR